MNALQNFVDKYGLWISKEELIEKAYRQLSVDGHKCYIINDKYINVDGQDFQLIKSRKKDRWIVKEF